MSYAQFQHIERELGWRYEYSGGRAHVEPRAFGIPMRLALPADAGSLTVIPLRPFEPSNIAKLVPVYQQAFGATAEYAECARKDLRGLARRSLEGYLAAERGALLSQGSFVAWGSGGRPVGALLMVRVNGQPLIDLLFVHPRWQRKGLARALLSQACNALKGLGEIALQSRVHCHNHGSYRWHLQQGFQEQPDWIVGQARASLLRWHIERMAHDGHDSSRLENRLQELEATIAELRVQWFRQLTTLPTADPRGVEPGSPP